MGTKKDPGKFDCYAAAQEDEPYFLLLARDASAPRLVEAWAQLRQNAVAAGVAPSTDMDKVDEARNCAQQMRQWHFSKKVLPAGMLVKPEQTPVEIDSRKLVEELQRRRTKAYKEIEKLVTEWGLANCDAAPVRVVRELRDQLSVLVWRYMAEAYNVGTAQSGPLIPEVVSAPTGLSAPTAPPQVVKSSDGGPSK